jgi:hypothetical protein
VAEEVAKSDSEAQLSPAQRERRALERQLATGTGEQRQAVAQGAKRGPAGLERAKGLLKSNGGLTKSWDTAKGGAESGDFDLFASCGILGGAFG